MPEYLSRHGTKPASGKRCGRRRPSPVADGAKSAAGTVNRGDDCRDEHWGQDHQKDSGCAEVLRHGFTHISAKADGIGPDANMEEARPKGADRAPGDSVVYQVSLGSAARASPDRMVHLSQRGQNRRERWCRNGMADPVGRSTVK